MPTKAKASACSGEAGGWGFTDMPTSLCAHTRSQGRDKGKVHREGEGTEWDRLKETGEEIGGGRRKWRSKEKQSEWRQPQGLQGSGRNEDPATEFS